MHSIRVSIIFIFILFLADSFSFVKCETIENYQSNSTMKNKINKNAWNMVHDFGSIFNITHWVLSREALKIHKWNKIWYSTFKKGKENNYFGIDNMPYAQQRGSLSKNTLHVYETADIKSLEKYMKDLNKDLKSHQFSEPEKRSPLQSNIWLIKMPYQSSPQSITSYMNKTQTAYDSKVFCYTEINDTSIEIFDVYKIDIDTTTIVKKFGTWTYLNGINIVNPDMWSRRASLEGHNFKIASAYSPPAITHINDKCTEKSCLKGMFADVLHGLSETMNFTFTIQRSYQWGSFINGTWNGMVGMLNRGESDLAVTDLTVTKDRASVIDFLPSLMDVNEELFIKNPGESLSMDAYIAPFSYNSWIYIGLWTTSLPLVLAAIIFYGQGAKSKEFELGYCYNFVAQTLIMRSTKKMPSPISSRIAFAVVMLAGIAFYYHWEAELVSYLAVRKTHLPFRNIKELAAHPRYKVIVGQGSIHLDQFRYSNDPTQIKIWKEKIEPYEKNLPLYEDLVKSMIKDPYSVAYAESGLKQYEEYIRCEIIDLGKAVYTAQLAWAMQKQSPFYLAFDYNIRRLKEIGAIRRYDKRYKIKAQWCPDYSGKPLSINQCITAFNVIVIGVLGGFLWLMIEIIIPRSWMQYFYAFGNTTFKKFLIKISGNSSAKDDVLSASYHSKTFKEIQFIGDGDMIAMLEKNSPIEQILTYERNVKQMSNRIQELEKENMFLKQNSQFSKGVACS